MIKLTWLDWWLSLKWQESNHTCARKLLTINCLISTANAYFNFALKKSTVLCHASSAAALS